MTYSWDRLLIDPVPGPRSASDFTGLDDVAPGVHRIPRRRRRGRQPDRPSRVWPPNCPRSCCSSIPPTARSGSPTRSRPPPAMSTPISWSWSTLAATPSPPAPMTVCAARWPINSASPPASAPVFPPDSSSPEQDSTASYRPRPSPNVWPISTPSPCPTSTLPRSSPSGMSSAGTPPKPPVSCRGCAGHHGVVEVRDAGDRVHLSPATTRLAWVDAKRAASITPAAHLTDCVSLAAAQRMIRDLTGISEIDYKTRKAARRAQTTGALDRRGSSGDRRARRHRSRARQRLPQPPPTRRTPRRHDAGRLRCPDRPRRALPTRPLTPSLYRARSAG